LDNYIVSDDNESQHSDSDDESYQPSSHVEQETRLYHAPVQDESIDSSQLSDSSEVPKIRVVSRKNRKRRRRVNSNESTAQTVVSGSVESLVTSGSIRRSRKRQREEAQGTEQQ